MDSFIEGAIKLGYTKTIKEDGLIILTKDNCLKVEVFAIGKSTNNFSLGAITDPDYSVNLLTTNGNSLYSWVDTSHSVINIIKNIIERVAVEMTPTEYRIKKMRSKRYKIVTDVNKFYEF